MPERSLQEYVYDIQNAVNAIRRNLRGLNLTSLTQNELTLNLLTIEKAIVEIGTKGGLARPSQVEIDSLTRRADERSRRQLGSFEASVIDAWVKADRANREILYRCVQEIASKYFW